MAVVVRDNPARSRFEATADGTELGYAYYDLDGSHVVFTHTEVKPEAEGQGVGGALAKFGLDQVRGEGKQAVPRCPFIAAWISRHPDCVDLVPAAYQALLER